MMMSFQDETFLRALGGDDENGDYVSYLVDSDGNPYEPYSLAWRFLGIFIDCDVEEEDDYQYNNEEGGDNAQRRKQRHQRMLGSGDGGGCSRKVLWAAYRDPKYKGGSIGEYQFYDWRTGEWDDSTCQSGRCAKMDCHEPRTHFQLVGVFKEDDGLEWAEQLFKHQGYCLWDGDKDGDSGDSNDGQEQSSAYEFMQESYEDWSNYFGCTELSLTDDSGNGLYVDTKPQAGGNFSYGIYYDEDCTQSAYMTWGEYIIRWYEANYYYYYYYGDGASGYELAAQYDIDVSRWNELMTDYKICQPCRAYNKVVVQGDDNDDDGGNNGEDGEGGSEQWGYNCYDDAGYQNCNQCYKFETKTDLEPVTAEDLERATIQGTILEIKVNGTRYGSGVIGHNSFDVKGLNMPIDVVTLVALVALSILLATLIAYFKPWKKCCRKKKNGMKDLVGASDDDCSTLGECFVDDIAFYDEEENRKLHYLEIELQRKTKQIEEQQRELDYMRSHIEKKVIQQRMLQRLEQKSVNEYDRNSQRRSPSLTDYIPPVQVMETNQQLQAPSDIMSVESQSDQRVKAGQPIQDDPEECGLHKQSIPLPLSGIIHPVQDLACLGDDLSPEEQPSSEEERQHENLAMESPPQEEESSEQGSLVDEEEPLQILPDAQPIVDSAVLMVTSSDSNHEAGGKMLEDEIKAEEDNSEDLSSSEEQLPDPSDVDSVEVKNCETIAERTPSGTRTEGLKHQLLTDDEVLQAPGLQTDPSCGNAQKDEVPAEKGSTKLSRTVHLLTQYQPSDQNSGFLTTGHASFTDEMDGVNVFDDAPGKASNETNTMCPDENKSLETHRVEQHGDERADDDLPKNHQKPQCPTKEQGILQVASAEAAIDAQPESFLCLVESPIASVGSLFTDEVGSSPSNEGTWAALRTESLADGQPVPSLALGEDPSACQDSPVDESSETSRIVDEGVAPTCDDDILPTMRDMEEYKAALGRSSFGQYFFPESNSTDDTVPNLTPDGCDGPASTESPAPAPEGEVASMSDAASSPLDLPLHTGALPSSFVEPPVSSLHGKVPHTSNSATVSKDIVSPSSICLDEQIDALEEAISCLLPDIPEVSVPPGKQVSPACEKTDSSPVPDVPSVPAPEVETPEASNDDAPSLAPVVDQGEPSEAASVTESALDPSMNDPPGELASATLDEAVPSPFPMEAPDKAVAAQRDAEFSCSSSASSPEGNNGFLSPSECASSSPPPQSDSAYSEKNDAHALMPSSSVD